MKQLTFNQYRKIDLTLLCILTAVFEYIATMATSRWFNLQAMAISITIAMTCIAMFRWGAYAVFPAFIGSAAYCIALGAQVRFFVIYCGGSLLCLAALPVLLAFGKENARVSFFKRSVFAVATYLAFIIGRWLFSLIFEFRFDSFIRFITTDVLSLLFAIVVLALLKNVDGMIEDQKAYLFRLEREKKEKPTSPPQDEF